MRRNRVAALGLGTLIVVVALAFSLIVSGIKETVGTTELYAGWMKPAFYATMGIITLLFEMIPVRLWFEKPDAGSPQVAYALGQISSDIGQVKDRMTSVAKTVDDVAVGVAEVKGGVAEVKGSVAEVKGSVVEAKAGMAEIRGGVQRIGRALVLPEGEYYRQIREIANTLGAQPILPGPDEPRPPGTTASIRTLLEEVRGKLTELGYVVESLRAETVGAELEKVGGRVDTLLREVQTAVERVSRVFPSATPTVGLVDEAEAARATALVASAARLDQQSVSEVVGYWQRLALEDPSVVVSIDQADLLWTLLPTLWQDGPSSRVLVQDMATLLPRTIQWLQACKSAPDATRRPLILLDDKASSLWKALSEANRQEHDLSRLSMAPSWTAMYQTSAEAIRAAWSEFRLAEGGPGAFGALSISPQQCFDALVGLYEEVGIVRRLNEQFYAQTRRQVHTAEEAQELIPWFRGAMTRALSNAFRMSRSQLNEGVAQQRAALASLPRTGTKTLLYQRFIDPLVAVVQRLEREESAPGLQEAGRERLIAAYAVVSAYNGYLQRYWEKFG